MRRLWLLFAQTVTVVLALYFVYTAVAPERHAAVRSQQMGDAAHPAMMLEAPPGKAPGSASGSYRAAAGRAMPAVVNIITSKTPKRGKHPLMRDPFFKKFFGDRDRDRNGDGDEDDEASLGSGVIVSAEGYILTNNH